MSARPFCVVSLPEILLDFPVSQHNRNTVKSIKGAKDPENEEKHQERLVKKQQSIIRKSWRSRCR